MSVLLKERPHYVCSGCRAFCPIYNSDVAVSLPALKQLSKHLAASTI